MQIIWNHDGIGQTMYNFPPFRYYCIIFHSANSQQLRLRSSSAAADQWTKSDASDRCWNASKLKNPPNLRRLRQSFPSPNDFKAFVTTSRTSKYSPALTRGKSRGQWENIFALQYVCTQVCLEAKKKWHPISSSKYFLRPLLLILFTYMYFLC